MGCSVRHLLHAAEAQQKIGRQAVPYHKPAALHPRCIGQDETLTSVTLSDKVLKVSVDLTQADLRILTAEDLAYSRASGITDEILNHNELDSKWDTVIIDFGAIGSIQVGKSAVRTNEYDMRYMDSSQFQLK